MNTTEVVYKYFVTTSKPKTVQIRLQINWWKNKDRWGYTLPKFLNKNRDGKYRTVFSGSNNKNQPFYLLGIIHIVGKKPEEWITTIININKKNKTHEKYKKYDYITRVNTKYINCIMKKAADSALRESGENKNATMLVW